MYTIKRTNCRDIHFQELVQALDINLALKNGEKNDFFSQHNSSEHIKYVVIAYYENTPIGCGALKEYNAELIEIKRMFVCDDHRGKGISKIILTELQTWARELGFQKCILETGDKMKEAIGLYKTNAFNVIPNYPPYVGILESICFEKSLVEESI